MKAFLALVILQLIVFVNCKNITKTTEFGKQGPYDLHIFTDYYNIPGTMGNRYEYVNFPPRGLAHFFNITYVRVRDYNEHLAEVTKVSGDVGTAQISISIKAPLFRGIEATVDMFGTYTGPYYPTKP